MAKFYITTPIYYVNANPHIGHAYTTVICDCLARYHRIIGDEVMYLTGTDEHGEKIKKAAESTGEEVKAFVDRVGENFKDLWKKINISYDFFIRTTDIEHIKTVQKAIMLLHEKGDIYKAKYQSLYCVPCESFWTDSQVKDASGVCPDCKRQVESIEEENYFFKLSKYENWLKTYLKDNLSFVQPKIRYNEVMGFLDNNKLEDLCISRPKKRVSWGIDLPIDNNYVVYVWFDALLNYISGIGFGSDNNKFNKWWPADYHVMAKDILRHHAIFWPIILKALDVPQPKTIFAHGWWKIGEEKMSKSKGNIVNPLDLIKDISVDAMRYFLLREVPVGLDGNYNWPAVVNRVNSDLANDLGNLLYRTLNMAEKYNQGNVAATKAQFPQEFIQSWDVLNKQYCQLMESLDFSTALERVFDLIRVMNKYIENTKPWVLWKENRKKEVEDFLYYLLSGIEVVAVYLYPFMPDTAISICRQLGKNNYSFNLTNVRLGYGLNYQISKEAPLFPRIETEKEK